MSKILSQEELDALLSHIKESGQIETVDKPYVKYDFKKKKALLVDFTDLEFYANKFSEGLKGFFSGFFLKNIGTEVSFTKSMTLRELKGYLKFPSGIGTFKNESGEHFLMVIESRAAIAFVELFFGGSSVSDVPEERPFTIIEQRVIRKLFKEAVNYLKIRFKEFFKDEFDLDDFNMTPKHITVFDDKDRLAVFEINLSLTDFEGAKPLGKYYLVFPLEFFPKEEDENKALLLRVEKGINDKILNALMDVMFNVKVELGKLEMTLYEIVNMKVGDLLVIDKGVTQELDVFVEDELKFQGVHGISRGMQAVKITKKI